MDAKGDAGADPENSERDGRDSLVGYIDTFFVLENFMKKYKISKKKGWPRSPRPAPKSTFGSRWLLFFTFIFNFGKKERPSPFCFGLCEPRATKTGKVDLLLSCM